MPGYDAPPSRRTVASWRPREPLVPRLEPSNVLHSSGGNPAVARIIAVPSHAPPGSWAPPPCGLATAPAGGVCGPICPLRVAFGDNERPLHSFVLLAPVERGPW